MSFAEGMGYSQPWWMIPKQIYLQCTSDLVPCAEALGYTMGKTLGSGTYAKVKAAWSPFEGKMVSPTSKCACACCKIFGGGAAQLVS